MKETLTTECLAKRWGMSPQTLENWRSQGKGPQYAKLSQGKAGTVIYRLKDIEEYEENHMKGGGKKDDRNNSE